MRPYDNGPWRKSGKHHKHSDIGYRSTEEVIAMAEELLAESAQLAREAGEELFQTSICTNALCGFVGSGYWIHCPNGHQVINGEITEFGRNNAVAVWN